MRIMPVLTLVVMVAALAVAPVVVQAQITNGPEIDNNNRIVGEDGGNIFYNGLAEGDTVESVVNLGLPSGGGTTPDGASPAATIVTISEISLDADRNRSVEIMAEGDNTAEAGGLTASLNEDGSYSVSASDGFESDVIVSFGVNMNGDSEAVSLLAAPATSIHMGDGAFLVSEPTDVALGSVEFNGDNAVVTAGPGEGALVISNPGSEIAAGDYATVSLDYEADGPANMAAIAFDGGLDPLAVNYCQLSGGNVAVGETKNIAVSMMSHAGAVLPAFQVVNQGDEDITVTISNMQVISAQPLSDYQVDPTVTVDVAALADWNLDGLNEPTGTASVADGILSLEADDDEVANAYAGPAIPVGTVTLEAMVQAVDGVDDSAFFALVLTDGVNTINAYVPAAQLTSMVPVTVSGTTTTGMDPAFFVAQAANFSADVESAVIRDVEEGTDLAVIGL